MLLNGKLLSGMMVPGQTVNLGWYRSPGTAEYVEYQIFRTTVKAIVDGAL